MQRDRETERSPLDPLQFYGAPRANIRPSRNLQRGMLRLTHSRCGLYNFSGARDFFIGNTHLQCLVRGHSSRTSLFARLAGEFYCLSHPRRTAVTALYIIQSGGNTLILKRERINPCLQHIYNIKLANLLLPFAPMCEINCKNHTEWPKRI